MEQEINKSSKTSCSHSEKSRTKKRSKSAQSTQPIKKKSISLQHRHSTRSPSRASTSRSSELTPRIVGQIEPSLLPMLITPFDPKDLQQDINIWLRKIGTMKRVHNWRNTTVTTLVTLSLRGLARRWYGYSSQMVRVERYPLRLTNMLLRKKENNESLLDYFYDKMALLMPCKLNEKQMVECIMGRISDSLIKLWVLLAKISNTNALKRYFDKCDANDRSKDVDRSIEIIDNMCCT